LQQLFNQDISEIAAQVDFMCEILARLIPRYFWNWLCCYNNHKEDSLETLCERLRSQYGIEISKQGLDQRFTSKASAFLLQVICQLMEIQYAPCLKMHACLDSFTKVEN
jgi:hypothetical protein